MGKVKAPRQRRHLKAVAVAKEEHEEQQNDAEEGGSDQVQAGELEVSVLTLVVRSAEAHGRTCTWQWTKGRSACCVARRGWRVCAACKRSAHTSAELEASHLATMVDKRRTKPGTKTGLQQAPVLLQDLSALKASLPDTFGSAHPTKSKSSQRVHSRRGRSFAL